MTWTRETQTRWRLDQVWTVRKRKGLWYAYRREQKCLLGWPEVEKAMREAEILREGDKSYERTTTGD